MLKAIVVSTCALISSAAIAQPIFSEVPTYGLPSKVNNLGTVVGTATANGYRWRPSDGLTTFAGIRITDISDDNQVMISPTHGKWTASTNQWQAPRGYQFNTTPCPNPPCIYYTQATQSYCNTDGSIIAGTAFEPPPNNCHRRAALWNSSGDTPAVFVSDGYLNGGTIECSSVASMKGVSSDGEVVWGIDENQNINAARAFVWHNGVKRSAFQGSGNIAIGGATPDGRYLAGFGVSAGGGGINFRGIYDTINLAHINFPANYWPRCMAETSMLVAGEFGPNIGQGRAFMRLESGQFLDLYDHLIANNAQGPIAGWTLLAVYAVSRNGRYLAGAGYNAQGTFRAFRVDLQGLTCDSIDFNNDGSTFDPQDIDAFLSVYSEGPCVPDTATCNDIDFNNDGSIFDPRDIDAFLSVYGEGPCF
ncbi:MAG: hypothetical protein U0640_13925 [Phycisphaerales bacterium]